MKLLRKIIIASLLLSTLIPLNAASIINKSEEIINNKDLLLPSATIAGTTTACQNSTQPQIIFTGLGGTAPYTFTYSINGVTQPSITTLPTDNTISVFASTATLGILNYSLISVSDANNSIQSQTGTATVTIIASPNASLGGTGSGSVVNGVPVFRVCINGSSLFTFTNTSTTTAINTNYTINWGDGSPNFTSTSWLTTTHTYAIGLWNLTISVEGVNGCISTKNYTVFVGSNPAVSLGNPGNTDICIGSSLTFPITGVSNNPPGTTYTVTFNDGSPSQTFNHPPPTSITHTFLVKSCGTTSSDGSNSYPNSFSVSIVATNPCSSSSVGVVPIYVSSLPIANFSGPIKGCVNTQICFANTSEGYQVAGGICYEPNKVWTISPATGYTIVNGSVLGNDFSSNNASLWQSGTDNLCVIFNLPGTYTISIKSGSKCGLNDYVDIETRTICIEGPLVPQFTISAAEGCSPLAITTVDNTNLSGQCPTPTYQWTVAYAAANCGTTSGYTFTNGTGSSSTEPSFNFIGAGIYTITLGITNSCGTYTATKTVIVKRPPKAVINAIPNVCQSSTSITINPTANITSCVPNSSSLTYLWSFPGGTPATSTNANPGTITYNLSGSYTVSLSVTNECGTTVATNKTFSVLPMPTITGILTACVNSTSQLSASTSGASNPWTVSPSGIVSISNTGLVTGIAPGTATITFTDINGCTKSIPFVVNPLPSATINGSSTICVNSTAQINLTGTNGAAPYTFTYNINNGPNITVSTVTGNSITLSVPTNTAGVYTYNLVSVSDGSTTGCLKTLTGSATITINALPTIVIQPLNSQSICIGGTIAPLSVSYSGGTGTPSYQWYSNSSNSTVGGTLIAGATSASYTPPVFMTAGTFYYYAVVSLSANGCGVVSSSSAEVIVVPDPTINIQPLASQTICQGSTASALNIVAIGGLGSYNYQWYRNTTNSASGGLLIAGATSNTYLPPTNTAGTNYYYCLITQNGLGCNVVSATATVNVNLAPTFTSQPISSNSCLGGIPSVLSVAYTNGVGTPTYQWFSNSINSNIGGTTISGAINSTYTPSNLTVGTFYYYCIITLPATGGCSSITSLPAEVIINNQATVTLQPTPTQSLCNGVTIQSPLAVSYTGGTGTASYQWYSNTTNSNLGGTLIPGATSSTYTPTVFTSTGTFYYYALVTFTGGGCGPIKSNVAEIIIVPDPIITTQPLLSQTICQNVVATTLAITVSGGNGTSYLYQWYTNTLNNNTTGTLIPGETSSSFTPPTTTIGTKYYYCKVNQTNGSNCSVISSPAMIIVNPSPTIVTQPISDAFCIGQATSILSVSYTNGVGIPQYQWYFNNINSTTGSALITGATNSTYTPSNSTVGTSYYYCEITFPSGGCSNIISNIAEIIINQSLSITPKNQGICTGSTFTVTPTNSNVDVVPIGTTYTWSYPIISPTGAVTGASAQNVPQSIVSQTLTNTTVNTATVVYTVTPVYGICVGADFTVTITVNPSINPNITIANSTCYGINNGFISTNVTGGVPSSTGQPYLISWSGPNGFTSSASNISGLAPGVYNLSIDGGCTFTNSYTILEPAQLVLTTDIENPISCFGNSNGQLSVSVTGGTGSYTYNWTKNNLPYSTNEDLTNLEAGVYVVLITDANSCGPLTATFTIAQPPVLEVSLISQTNVLCYGDATGSININTLGGTPTQITPGVFSYNYSWTGPNGFLSNSQNLSNLLSGTYNLVVTDNSGCLKNLSVTITQPTEILITAAITPITCYGANDASIATSIIGGNPNYQIVWSNMAAGLNQNNLAPGNYTITVTDASGCQKVLTVNIPDVPIFTVNPVVTNVSCFGAQNGSIVLNFSGGSVPANLVWSDGSTAGTTRNNLGPGTYTVTISNGTLCSIVKTFVIIEPQNLVLNATTTGTLNCSNDNNGAVNLQVVGGTTPYTYQWSNGNTTEDLVGVPAGNYLVTVTDAKGCTKQETYVITGPSQIVLNVDIQTIPNCENLVIEQSFTAQTTGGIPPYQFTWSSGTVSGAYNQTMTTSENGLITLQATDAIGCSASYSYNVSLPDLGNPTIETISIGYSTYGNYSIGDPIQFTSSNLGDYTSVSWDFGDGTFSTELNPVHTYLTPKDYVVTQTVTYGTGCVFVNIITLIIEKGYVLVVPTAFTPNNDAINDTYRPVTRALKKVRMDVFDTWGSLIYSESGEALRGWDGIIKGTQSENGNYFCKVTGETFYGAIVIESTPFVLIE